MNAKYKNPDSDLSGDWRSDNAYAPSTAPHQGMVYAIQHPFTGKLLYPSNIGTISKTKCCLLCAAGVIMNQKI